MITVKHLKLQRIAGMTTNPEVASFRWQAFVGLLGRVAHGCALSKRAIRSLLADCSLGPTFAGEDVTFC